MKNSWLNTLQSEGKKEYFNKIIENLQKDENEGYEILPTSPEIFRAFDYFQDTEVKVIFLGQDPYPNAKDADGLAFSSKDKKTPASLKNLFLEIKKDFPAANLESNDLTKWAKQGVLLLNTVLTVRAKDANSHRNFGWQNFTKKVVKQALEKSPKAIVVALGNQALDFLSEIKVNPENLLVFSHPSPLSYQKNLKDKHLFLEINKKLKANGLEGIDWSTK
ncbi:uracil-DNA glycosylase [Mycoplasma sp. Ms02]|uniref:uracil-DNA glycosylase n=1 Tax=Mycoplasma sp. Ms02 TaxID=353851 RepID=UPI001C8ACD5F|nr:uracil-DNA glycosylase [Mycoplasma sp. Ms02]QZE12382.1 uracil-DNA glycosylase [Mycoplasma sp. Ms02]